MAPSRMKVWGQNVTATLKKCAALVPMETKLFMLAERWRTSFQNPTRKCSPTQNCTGVVRTSCTQGDRKTAGIHGKSWGKLPSRTGSVSMAPTRNFRRRSRFSRSRSARSRSGASTPVGITSGISYPAALTALLRSAIVTRPESSLTVAFSVARFTLAWMTPGTPARAASTLLTQEAQCIPLTGSVSFSCSMAFSIPCPFEAVQRALDSVRARGFSPPTLPPGGGGRGGGAPPPGGGGGGGGGAPPPPPRGRLAEVREGRGLTLPGRGRPPASRLRLQGRLARLALSPRRRPALGPDPPLLARDLLPLLDHEEIHQPRQRMAQEVEVLLPVAGRVGQRPHLVQCERQGGTVALPSSHLELLQHLSRAHPRRRHALGHLEPLHAKCERRRATAAGTRPVPAGRAFARVCGGSPGAGSPYLEMISYSSRSNVATSWRVSFRCTASWRSSSPSRSSASRCWAISGLTRFRISCPPRSAAAAWTLRKISAATVRSDFTTPLPLQVGQDVQNRDCRSWRTRLRVISTSPSSEISRTLVRALSSPSAFWRAWKTCWRWSSRSMSMKSMMMIPPRSRRRIWRTASPTASRLILRTVCSKSRLPTYLPVFTSMATRASVWSMTM